MGYYHLYSARNIDYMYVQYLHYNYYVITRLLLATNVCRNIGYHVS